MLIDATLESIFCSSICDYRDGESTNSEQRKNVFYDILRIREKNDGSVSPR